MRAPFQKLVKNEQTPNGICSVVEFRIFGLLWYRKVLVQPKDGETLTWGF